MSMNGLSIWLKRIALLSFFSVTTSAVVSAQTSQGSQSNLQTVLVPGSTVWITDSDGREEKARVVGVDDDIVTVDAGGNVRGIRTTEVMRVRARRSDSVVNGALIGAGAAVATGLFLCRLTEPWQNCRDDVGPMFRIGAIGAGIGIGIDALIRRRGTIYEASRGSTELHAVPIVGRRAGGLQVSLSF
jgi:hypothetical protein